MDSAARKRVVVFGSLNMDLVVRVPRMPEAGETLTGHGFLSNPGGKGANQAVACARQGAEVSMVGRVGADAFGEELCEGLLAQGIDASGVGTATGMSTGVAAILVDDAAQNSIAVVPGANALVTEADAEALRPLLEGAALLLLQLEVPMQSVVRAAQVAHGVGCTVLLNPAPAQTLPDALWPLIDILVLNETEARMLSGLATVDTDNAAEAAALLARRGPKEVIVTLGADGVVWHSPLGMQRFRAKKVKAVDTTAAGDTFIGALAALRVEGKPMEQALAHAIRAAAICVTRPGAQASMPTRAEVDG
jgi:ribokinase